MPSELYEILGLCGMAGKEMSRRRRLVDYAWQNCTSHTPYVLDQLLTHAGMYTGLRILAVISMFGYDEAKSIYPVLSDGSIPPPDLNIIIGLDESEDMEDVFPSSLEQLNEIIDESEDDEFED